MKARLDNGEIVTGDLAFQFLIRRLATLVRDDGPETAELHPVEETATRRFPKPE